MQRRLLAAPMGRAYACTEQRVSNPTTLAILETAFDEAWATLDGNGDLIRPGELARCMLRLAMEGERDPGRLRERALSSLSPSITWREAS
jgi:hypothetical protein